MLIFKKKKENTLIKKIIGWFLVSQFFPALFVVMNIGDDGSLCIAYLGGLMFTLIGFALFGFFRLIMWLTTGE